MGKDGGGGDGGGGYSYSAPVEKTVFDVHIATLQLIENELQRLHHDLRVSAGDDDVTQEQIAELHAELARLSEQLGDAEAECITNGKT